MLRKRNLTLGIARKIIVNNFVFITNDKNILTKSNRFLYSIFLRFKNSTLFYHICLKVES